MSSCRSKSLFQAGSTTFTKLELQAAHTKHPCTAQNTRPWSSKIVASTKTWSALSRDIDKLSATLHHAEASARKA